MVGKQEEAITYHKLNKGVITQTQLTRNLRTSFGLTLLETKCLMNTGSFDLDVLGSFQEKAANAVQQLLEADERTDGMDQFS